ncbi:MAG TPA: SDR family oxidoreductase [Streptosporangiaceae bacterium]|nr:SDR family oxidoreductase [Streptosporangiaceae bacterium]
MSVAVVTGAGGSLGRAIARRLAADGQVVAVTDIDATGLDQTREAVLAAGGEVRAWPVDLRDAAAIAGFFAAVAAGPGPAAVLVNNAAIYPTTPFLDIDVQEYDEVHAVNQRGYWLCAQAAARQMRASGGGAIVNIASITMHGGWANLASYVATKGAAAALTRALARELGPAGIRVNAVSPGAFPTAAEQIYDDPAAYNQHVLDQQSLKRRGTPDELAAVVSFLTGADSSFVTGQTIEVNGGWVMS